MNIKFDIFIIKYIFKEQRNRNEKVKYKYKMINVINYMTKKRTNDIR